MPKEEMKTEEIYAKALTHWTSVKANVDGMLGGFARLNEPDIRTSKELINRLKNTLLLNDHRALDCGSGVGRVTKHLLLPLFECVDMVDFAQSFIEISKAYIGAEGFKRVGQQFVESLHTFEPAEDFYDLIWIQWVSGQLSDNHLVDFLRRCKAAIREGGCIVVKENVASGESREFDSEDYSWTRPKAQYTSLFQKAGLQVKVDQKQPNFPKGIYEVRIFALKPASA